MLLHYDVKEKRVQTHGFLTCIWNQIIRIPHAASASRSRKPFTLTAYMMESVVIVRRDDTAAVVRAHVAAQNASNPPSVDGRSWSHAMGSSMNSARMQSMYLYK